MILESVLLLGLGVSGDTALAEDTAVHTASAADAAGTTAPEVRTGKRPGGKPETRGTRPATKVRPKAGTPVKQGPKAKTAATVRTGGSAVPGHVEALAKPPELRTVSERIRPPGSGARYLDRMKRIMRKDRRKIPKSAFTTRVNRSKLKAREDEAPAKVRSELQSLRDKVERKKYKFRVGYTEALDQPMDQLTGYKEPANLEKIARERNAKAETIARKRWVPNLMQRKLRRPQAITPDASGPAPEGKSSEVVGDPFEPMVGDASCSPSMTAWSWKEFMVPPRSQGACGSCWAFSTLAVFEAAQNIANGFDKDLDFSEQHIVDCATTSSGSDIGTCAGGFTYQVYEYLEREGAPLEKDVPYLQRDASCNSKAKVDHKIANWGFVDGNGLVPSVAKMKEAICKYGPVSSSVFVSPAFKAYAGGVDRKSVV